jgi:hypothetical protein
MCKTHKESTRIIEHTMLLIHVGQKKHDVWNLELGFKYFIFLLVRHITLSKLFSLVN